MGKAPCCDKENVKKGPWSPEEDAKLKEYIQNSGTGGNWISLPAKAGLRRCGKSCRLRWLNYLRPNIKHGDFTDDEDRIICTLFASIGSRWSIIAAQLPGRTDNDIKNYWNTKLKKKKLHLKMATDHSPKTPQFTTKLQNLVPTSVISSSATTISSSCNYNDTPSHSLSTPYVKKEPSFSLSSPFGLQTDHEYVQDCSIKRFGGEVDSICSDGSSIKQVGYNKDIEHDYFGDLFSNTLDVDLQGYLCFGVNQSNQWGNQDPLS